MIGHIIQCPSANVAAHFKGPARIPAYRTFRIHNSQAVVTQTTEALMHHREKTTLNLCSKPAFLEAGGIFL